jgi:hypothetical protein
MKDNFLDHETDLPTLSSAASTNLQGEVELGAISSSNRCDSEESLEFQPKIVTGFHFQVNLHPTNERSSHE